MSAAPIVIAGREDRKGLGVLLMAAGVTFMTCIDTSAKWLLLAGLPVLQIVFMRYAVHFLLSAAMFLPREGTAVLRSHAPVKQVLRGLFLLGSTIFNFAALQYLPITMTTAIAFAGPITVTLLSIPILGERVGIHRILAVLTGFAGVLVVIQPWGAEFDPAVFLSLAAMTCGALYMILTRMLAGVDANATSQLWSSGLSALAFLPAALPVWQWPDTASAAVMLVMVGVFGGLGHTLATQAARYADASMLAPVVYLQILTSALAGILVFATWPTLWTLAGGVIIAAASLYIWKREARLSRGR